MRPKFFSLVLCLFASCHTQAQKAHGYTQQDVKAYFQYLDNTSGSAAEERVGDLAHIFITSPDSVLTVLKTYSKGTQEEYLSMLGFGLLNMLYSQFENKSRVDEYLAWFYNMMPKAVDLNVVYKWQMETLLEEMKIQL